MQIKTKVSKAPLSRRGLLILALLGPFTFVGAPKATGEEQPSSGATVAESQNNKADRIRLDEIVVTAQKRTENVQDVPISMSVLSGETLLESRIDSTTDLVQLAPSLTFSQANNDLNSSVRLRGIGTQANSSAIEPSVSFILDDVVLARQGQGFMDLMDIERVEVLRGPQGTLFGKNSSAGVIRLVTKRPTEEFSFSGEVLAAEGDEQLVRATASGPISNSIGYRLTTYYRDVDGYIKNVYDGRDINSKRNHGLRGMLEIDVNENLNVLLSADYRKTDDDCCQFQPRRVDSPLGQLLLDPVAASKSNRKVNTNGTANGGLFNKAEAWGASVQIDYQLGDHTLTSITANRGWKNANNLDGDGLPTTSPVVGIISLDFIDGETDMEQFSQELRLTSPSGGRFEYVAGLFAWKLDLDRFFGRTIDFCFPSIPANAALGPGEPCVVPTNFSTFFNGNVENTNYAAFGELKWYLNETVELFAGLRYQEDEIDFKSVTPPEPLIPGTIPFFDPVTNIGTIEDEAVSGRLGIMVDITDNSRAYFTYSRGYKGPTVDVALESDDTPIDPETSDAFELGIKSELFDNRLAINIATFWAEYEDFQAQTFDPVLLQFELENAGSLRTQGVEMDFQAAVTENLTLSGGVAYTDANFEDFEGGQCFTPSSADPDCINGVKDLSGADLTNSPDWKFNITAHYETTLPYRALTGFVRGSYVWQDEVQFDIAQHPETIQESYGLFDLSAGFKTADERYTVTVFAKNLFDKEYVTSISSDAVRFLGSTGFSTSHHTARNSERYVGMSIRVDY